jgi:15-cis-phytoene synthase
LGVSNVVALRHAAQLGMAMQLTNVCRDVAEDWRRGRIYLPADVLRGFGARELTPSGQLLPTEAVPALATSTRFVLAWAEVMYQAGEKGLCYLPPRAALAVRTARLVYADIGRVIVTRGANPLAPRAVVSRSRKVALVARALVSTAIEPRPRFVRAQLSSVLGVEDVVCL